MSTSSTSTKDAAVNLDFALQRRKKEQLAYFHNVITTLLHNIPQGEVVMTWEGRAVDSEDIATIEGVAFVMATKTCKEIHIIDAEKDPVRIKSWETPEGQKVFQPSIRFFVE